MHHLNMSFEKFLHFIHPCNIKLCLLFSLNNCKNCMALGRCVLVYDRNQVLLLGTKTKDLSRYQYWSWIFFSKTENSDFLMFQTLFRNISFYRVENKQRSSKIILKNWKFDKKICFKGTFYDGKNISCQIISILVTRLSLWNVVSVSVTVSAESISLYRF